MALRTLADEDESEWRASSKALCRCLYRDLYRRVGQRMDASYIRIFAESGEEPPDFIWLDDVGGSMAKPVPRARVSRRGRRRLAEAPRNRRGFRHHLTAEQLVCETVRKAFEYDRERTYGRKEAEPVFAETHGVRQLFSITEASDLYSQAERKFCRENQAYVELTIRDLLKRGNRRGLAKAPSKEAIDCLRRDFPNAAEAIDEVERAAALAWMTPDGWFRMSPLLIWGEPGVGKTAFLQALAVCLNVPFRRHDVGALTIGAELFGLSLSWSTGRTGDIFNLLSEGTVMNPVILLDELDKAAGNDNSPVIPPLLSLLEPETSRSFRDEAIPLALDASHVVWCASGNDHRLMSGPLRSRFNEVKIERPEGEAAVQVAGSIYRSLCKASPWGKKFPAEIDRDLAKSLASHTPRQMMRLLTVAFGQAALRGRTYLKLDDFPTPPKSKGRMGFV
jgi:ATP-dependent Lon protease